MLFGHEPHDLKPGQNVLVWGASGGLGSFAIQLINTAGANAIGVISDEDKRDFVMDLGAKGVINRKDFNCWGQPAQGRHRRIQGLVRRGPQVRQGDLGHHRQGRECRHGVRTPRRGDLPGLHLRVKRGGMVVICAGTTGFNCTFDVRHMWCTRSACRAPTSRISSRRQRPTS
jgi:crotonyl-CoA carboxylase/reductase